MSEESYKAELLGRLSNLPAARLQKLLDYSDFIIIPDEDLLIDVTQSQMVEKAHRLADSLFPEWTDRGKADFGEFLIELFALFSEKDFWYLNAFANENILRKMHSYSNAYLRASAMGYVPKTCKGGNVSFSVAFKPGEAITYKRGDIVISMGDYEFSNDSDFTIEASSGSITRQLGLFEGKQEIEDIPYNGYSVFIRKKNIDLDSLSVSVGGVTYDRVNNFGSSTSDSYHFLVLPEEDGACSIFFGNNGFGVQPMMNDLVHVEYRRCNGKLNLPEVLEAKVKDSRYEREAESAVYLSVVNNNDGENAESLTSIIETAPMFFQSRNTIINIKSALLALSKFSFAQRVAAEIFGSTITYYVIPNRYGVWNVNDAERGILLNEFEPYLSVGYNATLGTLTEGMRLDFIRVEMDTLGVTYSASAKVVIKTLIYKGYSSKVVEDGVRSVFLGFCNPWINGDFGAEFNRNDLDLRIRANVEGVQSVSFLLDIGTELVQMTDFKLGDTEILNIFDSSKLQIEVDYAF